MSTAVDIAVKDCVQRVSTTRRDRAKANICLLMDAALELWTAESFDLVSVDDICARAGLAKGTFYNYFEKKDALLIALIFSHVVPDAGSLKTLLRSNRSTLSICCEVFGPMGARVRTLPKPLVQLSIDKAFCQHDNTAKLYCTNYDFRSCIRQIMLRAVSRGEVQSCWKLSALAGTLGWSILQGIQFWARGSTADGVLAADLEERVEFLLRGAANRREMPGPRSPAVMQIERRAS